MLRSQLAIPLALVLVITLVGCAPKPAVAKVATTPAAPPATSGVANPVRPAPGSPIPGRSFDESLLRGREFLLSAGAAKTALTASDNDLGDLASEQDPVVRVARALFKKIALKESAAEELSPRWKEYLQTKISRWSQGPWNWTQVRFAAVKHPEEGGALLEFVVEGSSGRGRGQIYLSSSTPETWLVEDLELATLDSENLFRPEEVSKVPLVR